MKKFLLFFLVGFFCSHLQAQQTVPASLQVLDGSLDQIKQDSTRMVEDGKFFDNAYDSKLVKPYKVQNRITLQVNSSSPYYIQSAFDVSVVLTAELTDGSEAVSTVSIPVSLHYSNEHVNDRYDTIFTGYHRVKITVASVSTNVGWDVWKCLKIENELQPFPLYHFDCTQQAVQSVSHNNPASNTHDDVLNVSWSYIEAGDVYDLEWTYIDSSALANGRYGNGADPDRNALFDNNTSRVTITGTSFPVPLIYDGSGSLFFRVRAVQNQSNGGRIESKWSSDFTSGLGRFDFKGHERSLNWQATTTYAEEGKHKTVVQYYDGSLRSRQTVTKDNTTDSTIVAESYYDYQGRPVIQVLPVPGLSNIIHYSRDFNIALNGSGYDKDNFDRLLSPGTFCNAGADAMKSDSGAARYYSAYNPNKNNAFNRFIPDAEGFPFTEVEYTADNTGRIRRQGGLGPTYQLGSGHETKYYYGSADQRELDALFGTEVGDQSHYFKNMVRDANGQYSVSYVDMHGRTIATALAGALPNDIKLDTLQSRVTRNLTETISSPSSAIIRDLVMENKKSLLVSSASNHTFTYQLNPQTLSINDKNNVAVCYECLYDLQITITDDCNNQHLPGGVPFDTVIHNFSLNAIDTTCNNDPGTFSFSFTKFLEEGNYEVTKKLTVNRQAADYYREKQFEKRNRAESLETFTAQQRSVVYGILQCQPTCQSCTDSVGTWSSFYSRFKARAGVDDSDTTLYDDALLSFQSAQDACNILCNTNQGEVSETRKAMILDMVPPSGQYANADSTQDRFSIFYVDATANPATTAIFRNPAIQYVDENGNPEKVFDEKTGNFVTPQNLSVEAYIQNFKLSWADSLLRFHPEYCKLKNVNDASSHWDKRFEAVDTYAEAMAKGYLNPTHNTSNSRFTKYNATGTSDYDPNTISKSKLEDSITLYRTNYTMWSVASAMAYCGGKPNTCISGFTTDASAFNTSTTCAADLDMAWRNFRQLYLDVKRKLVNDALKINVDCINKPDVATLVNMHHQPHFSDAREMMTATGNNVPADISGAQALAQTAANDYYDANCKAYIKIWWQQIKDCYNSTDSSYLMPRLIQICKDGSDTKHPYGSSSVAPSSSNTDKSFEKLLADYNTANGKGSNFCNPYRITTPKPYDQQNPYSAKPIWTKPEDCECERINTLKTAFQSLPAGQYSSFSDYLKKAYQTTISDSVLNVLSNLCAVNPLTASCVYSASPIQLPPALQCNTGDVCVGCHQVGLLNTEFKSKYPGVNPKALVTDGDTVQFTKNHLYEQFMNYKTGFAKTTRDYLDFLDSCGLYAADTLKGVVDSSIKQYTFIKKFLANKPLYIKDVEQAADGGYYVIGRVGNGTAADGYFMKTDEKGTQLWAKSFGGTGTDEFNSVIKTKDGGALAIGLTQSFGLSKPNIYVVKLDSLGTKQWSKRMHASSLNGEYGIRAIQTADSGYVFACLYNNGSSIADWLLIRTNSVGTVAWNRRCGVSSTDFPGALLEDGDSIILASIGIGSSRYDGFVSAIKTSTGVVGWTKKYDLETSKTNWFYQIHKNSNGYSIGVNDGDDYNGTNGVEIRLNIFKNGNVSSITRVTPVVASTNSCVNYFPTPDEGFVAIQSETTNPDIYISRSNAAGSNLYANRIKMAGPQYGYRIIQTSDKGYMIVGFTDTIGLMIKLDTSARTGCVDSALTMNNTVPTYTVSSQTYLYNTTVSISSVDLDTLGVPISSTNSTDCFNDPYFKKPVSGKTLCGRAEPLSPPVDINTLTNCSDSSFFIASNSIALYEVYKDSLMGNFDSAYRAKCMSAYQYETFTVSHPVSEYHHTLYYYDQAGNLIKTVPPAGVRARYDDTFLGEVEAARLNHEVKVPSHVMVTEYRFNSLNMVVNQKSPDGGQSHLWYDRLGRLAFSQNAKQKAASVTEAGRQYSYTMYDYLGRITEVGQITNASSTAMSDAISRSPISLDSWITPSVAGKEQITQTVYDIPYSPMVGFYPNIIVQRNLRNRVSYSSFTQHNSAAAYNQATFYTYDIHGNVDTLLQDYGREDNVLTKNIMNALGNRFKKIVYQFDLISGKVNQMAYQPNLLDQFYHRYRYDSDNRMTEVETSVNGITWEKDARYQYYQHGPLARMVLGDLQVQGVDYAYTLQGWLKGVNSTSLDSTFDMGKDGDPLGTNKNIPSDVYGLNLNYNNLDFHAINAAYNPFPGHSTYYADANGYRPLYNGNISSMAVNLKPLYETDNSIWKKPLLYNYTYDQLNRLTAMDTYYGLDQTNNSWSGLTATRDFRNSFTYDPNGNILKQVRWGANSAAVGHPIDSMAYIYGNGNNQLTAIEDTANISSPYSNDFAYDGIGNLVKNTSSNIPQNGIIWNMYGKITEVRFDNPSNEKPIYRLLYTYDASGNRISKRIYKFNSANQEVTWYSRDASGNIMATYTSIVDSVSELDNFILTSTERNIYGATRLGVLYSQGNYNNTGLAATYLSSQNHNLCGEKIRGNKYYELSNHLGNVLTTITDRKIAVPLNDSNLIKNYRNNIATVQDYYGFGMNMSERSIAYNSTYRYAFNGKEKDGDISGTQYDYGFRIYDSRIGKFLSTDPIADKYPWYSPYQFAGNTPIQAIDIDGLEEYVVTNYYNRFGQIDQTTITFLNDKELKQVVNLHLVTSSGQRISPNHKVLVRNIGSRNQLISYERRQSLNRRESNVLNGGSSSPINEPRYNPFGVEFTDGQYLTSDKKTYTDEKYEGLDMVMQFRPVPPPPPFNPGTEIKNFKGSNNYYVGISPFNNAGELGQELTGKLETIAKSLTNPDSKIKTVTVTATQVIGAETTASEAAEANRQVNMAINNMIDLLKNKTKNKKIKFVNGGANVIQSTKTADKIPDTGTKIKFDK